jgi:hypothetical protein
LVDVTLPLFFLNVDSKEFSAGVSYLESTAVGGSVDVDSKLVRGEEAVVLSWTTLQNSGDANCGGTIIWMVRRWLRGGWAELGGVVGLSFVDVAWWWRGLRWFLIG